MLDDESDPIRGLRQVEAQLKHVAQDQDLKQIHEFTGGSRPESGSAGGPWVWVKRGGTKPTRRDQAYVSRRAR